jgi:hypothetical protein
VKVGKIVISGSGALSHISIRFFKHPDRAIKEQGLRLLLETFGARLTREDVLVPCFDLEEMTRRNRDVRLKAKEK